MAYVVFEAASWENLNEAAYVEANPDVKKAGMSARDHFRQYGEAEGRPQFSSEYMLNLESYRAEKFRRFLGVLDLCEADLAKGTFPITVGRHHFELAEYMFESVHPGFWPFDAAIESNPNSLYLDIGCGLKDRLHPNCLYLEVYPSLTADLIVEPTCLYPIKSSSLDGIGCFAVLEHTRKPWLVVQEMQRMLKPGGKVFIDWPFLQPVHGFPSHFYNATREGLCSLFQDNGFEIETATTGAHQTPAYTVNWILCQLLARVPEGAAKDGLRKTTIEQLSEIHPQSDFWLTIMNELPPSAIAEFACGNWLAAVKK